jgi:hypothetical protein
MIRYERDGELLAAHADVAVGVDRLAVSVPLGPWLGAPPHPGGLRGLPVVLLLDELAATLVAAGARRSGRVQALLTSEGPEAPSVLLRSGADVAIVRASTPTTATWVLALGGRPLPALPLDDVTATSSFLDGLAVDVDIAVPSEDPATRAAARATLGRLVPPTGHQLVEVDPRPAFEEAGIDAAGASLSVRAAAAAGVLAGRVAAGNLRWRAST